jgi:hypothetical protein
MSPDLASLKPLQESTYGYLRRGGAPSAAFCCPVPRAGVRPKATMVPEPTPIPVHTAPSGTEIVPLNIPFRVTMPASARRMTLWRGTTGRRPTYTAASNSLPLNAALPDVGPHPGHRLGRRAPAGDGRTCGGRWFQAPGQDGRADIGDAESVEDRYAPRPNGQRFCACCICTHETPGCLDPQQARNCESVWVKKVRKCVAVYTRSLLHCGLRRGPGPTVGQEIHDVGMSLQDGYAIAQPVVHVRALGQ